MIDLGALLSQLVSTYWWVPLLYVLAALFKSAWFKQTVKPGTGTPPAGSKQTVKPGTGTTGLPRHCHTP